MMGDIQRSNEVIESARRIAQLLGGWALESLYEVETMT